MLSLEICNEPTKSTRSSSHKRSAVDRTGNGRVDPETSTDRHGHHRFDVERPKRPTVLVDLDQTVEADRNLGCFA